MMQSKTIYHGAVLGWIVVVRGYRSKRWYSVSDAVESYDDALADKLAAERQYPHDQYCMVPVGTPDGFVSRELDAIFGKPPKVNRRRAPEEKPSVDIPETVLYAENPSGAQDTRAAGGASDEELMMMDFDHPGYCPKCGTQFVMVRPGKSQATCDCHETCVKHGRNKIIYHGPDDFMQTQGYFCADCANEDGWPRAIRPSHERREDVTMVSESPEAYYVIGVAGVDRKATLPEAIERAQDEADNYGPMPPGREVEIVRGCVVYRATGRTLRPSHNDGGKV
jgi:hypothetical protein